jgi:hypothetical protein
MKEKSRSSTGDWPDLEMALFEWQQRMEQKKAIITGDLTGEGKEIVGHSPIVAPRRVKTVLLLH